MPRSLAAAVEETVEVLSLLARRTGQHGEAGKHGEIEGGSDDLKLPEACLRGDHLHQRILKRQDGDPGQQKRQRQHRPVTLRPLEN